MNSRDQQVALFTPFNLKIFDARLAHYKRKSLLFSSANNESSDTFELNYFFILFDTNSIYGLWNSINDNTDFV